MLAVEPLAVHPRPVVMALGALYSRSLRRFQPEIQRVWDARRRSVEMGNWNMIAVETSRRTVLCLKPACFSCLLVVQDHGDVIEIVVLWLPAAGVQGRIAGLVTAQKRALNVRVGKRERLDVGVVVTLARTA